jgi:hypothetical protein
MKFIPRALRVAIFAAFIACCPQMAFAQTLNWGSEVFSELVDSRGQTLEESEMTFQLGAFEVGFVPTSENTNEWFSHWRVFDEASYNQAFGYFTSTAHLNDDGSSSDNPGAGFSFEGLTAFLWIRNSPDLTTSTEWFLGTASAWVFPDAVPGCCDNESVIEWSVSDMETPDMPVWGSQSGVAGAGHYTVTGGYTLQTFTIIPEASTSLLVMLSGLALLAHRSRKQ